MNFFKQHIEWVAFLVGLILMGAMDPYTTAHSFCFFEWIGFPICLGEGLGHSIAFLFRGELKLALEANLFGPFAVVMLAIRICSIWKELLLNTQDLLEPEHV